VGGITMAYPEEYISPTQQLVTKDGKKYFKTAHYKLAYYTYEPVKPYKDDLPAKLLDIISKRD